MDVSRSRNKGDRRERKRERKKDTKRKTKKTNRRDQKRNSRKKKKQQRNQVEERFWGIHSQRTRRGKNRIRNKLTTSKIVGTCPKGERESVKESKTEEEKTRRCTDWRARMNISTQSINNQPSIRIVFMWPVTWYVMGLVFPITKKLLTFTPNARKQLSKMSKAIHTERQRQSGRRTEEIDGKKGGAEWSKGRQGKRRFTHGSWTRLL